MTITPDTDRIDIREPVRDLCRRLGLDETYVARIDVTPSYVTVDLYCGRDGRCLGPKFVHEGTSNPAMETMGFEVLS